MELTTLQFNHKVFKLHTFRAIFIESGIDPEQDIYYEYCDRVFILVS
jgi:hypothetical protein